MMHGRLTLPQSAIFLRLVEGKVVHDLGAGNLGLSIMAVYGGAKRVFAVDKIYTRTKRAKNPDGVEVVGCHYSNYKPEDIEVALISWPTNMVDPSLIALARRAKTVIYLGKNTDGTACGCPGLFQSFLERELLWYRPHRANTLAVYGDHLVKPRSPEGEEYAGMHEARLYSFDEAERIASELREVVHELAAESL